MPRTRSVFSYVHTAQGALGVLLMLFASQASVSARSVAPAATVVSVQPTRVADLILLDHGFNAGLRQGMVCRITRGSADVAEILLVELRSTCSSALILSVAPRQAIRPGDIASLKILKS